MASVVDDFLARYAYPELKVAGFKRRRRELILNGPHGMVGVVGFRPYALPESDGFFFNYGVVTPGLIQWRVARDIFPPSWLSPAEALLIVQVFTPDVTQLHGDPGSDPYRWRLGDDDWNGWLGEQLRVAIREQVVPSVRAWFDPRELADAIRDRKPGRFGHMSPRARSIAMALFEAGPSPALDQELALLDSEDPVRRWIESELNGTPYVPPELPAVTPPPADTMFRRGAQLIIDGVGQFEFDWASDWVVYIRISESVADELTAGSWRTTFARKTGFGRGSRLRQPPVDRVWIQACLGDAVLVIRREPGPEHAAFFLLGPLGERASKSSPRMGVQVFIVVGDEDLEAVLERARPLGRITHPTMWGALVACTAEG